MTQVRGWLGGRVADALAVAAMLALAAGFFYEMVLLDAVPVARDIQLFFLPHKHILWEALQRGDLPLWTPLVRTGHPFLANFQSGVFYPPHWLYAVLPFLPAFNLLVVFHVALAGVGGYLLARTLDFEPVPSFIAALAFMSGGYLVSLTNLVNHLQAAAWTPLMVLVLIRHVEEWRLATLLQALGVYLVAFLAGAPQTFLLASVTALLVAAVRAPSPAGAGGGRRRLRAAATLAGLAVGVAALAAVQLLPTVEMVRLSGRASGLGMEEAGRYSLAPVRLLHMVLPNDFSDPVYRFGGKTQLSGADPWLFSVYLGVSVLVVAWHARLDRERRGLVALWWGLGLAGVVLALGKNLPVFPWLYEHVPGLSAFRYPEKFFLLTGFSVPMLAGHGASALLGGGQPPDRWDAAAALGALAAGAAGFLAWSETPARIHGWLREIAPDAPALEHFSFAYVEWGAKVELMLGVLAVTVFLVLLHRTGRLDEKPFLLLLVVAVGVDLWLANRSLTPVVDPEFYREAPPVLRQVEDRGVDIRTRHRWRASPFDENVGDFWGGDLSKLTSKWVMQHSMQPSTAAFWGVQGHDAMDAIHLQSMRTMDWLFRELPTERRLRLLRLGGVGSVYAGVVNDDLAETAEVTPADSVPGYLHHLADPLPRAYLARGRCYEEELDALNAALRPSADFSREVAILTERGTAELERPASPTVPGARGGGEGDGQAENRPRGDSIGVEDGAAGQEGPAGGRVGAGSGPCAEAGVRDGGSPGAGSERPSGPGSARIVEDSGERVAVEVAPEEPAFLVLADTWYPGWQASVDGEETRIWRANYFFRAVRVEPEDRTVVFRFRPRSFEVGRGVSLGALVLLLLVTSGWRLRARSG